VNKPTTVFLHYTAAPIIGGVEGVMLAHAETFVAAGYPVTVVVGRGAAGAQPDGVEYVEIPDLDSRHPDVLTIGAELEAGHVPATFEAMTDRIEELLVPILSRFDNVIVHNVFTKRFNLPLTAALFRLLDRGIPPNYLAWCHDFDWTGRAERKKVHPGYPWDLLRTYRPEMTYVTVSQQRRRALAGLLERPLDEIRVVYNGVDARRLLDLSDEAWRLAERFDLCNADLVLLMPVRVTRAKNIEYALAVVAALQGLGIRTRLVLTGPPDPHDPKSLAYFRSLRELRREMGVEEEICFVFAAGPRGEEGYTINMDVVSDLYRLADLMFMPSHREGFAMPVLEAGLVGLPVVSTAVPAAAELAADEAMLIGEDEPPEALARRLSAWAEQDPVHRLKRRVRRGYLWQTIFDRDIEPLLHRRERS
jgi:mannosylglucosylglycerate synthase